MKKTIALGIVILFVIMSFTSISGIQINNQIVNDSGRGNIIIVDDEGDGDYTSIKDAVNNASSGDTIEVYSGTYYECDIEIYTENITLKGIPYELGNGGDTGKPFINGEGKDDVIRIKSPRITIDNFRIENKGGTGAHGIIGIWRDADNCVVSHNDISYSFMSCISCSSNNSMILNNNISHSIIRHGIVVGGKYNTISGNVVSDNSLEGILVWDGENNIITGNIVKRCNEGICLIGNSNLAKQNVLEDNVYGLTIFDSFFNVIKQNNFLNNRMADAYFYIGLYTIPLPSIWNNNYWGRPRIFPKPIFGFYLSFIPWITFDWNPAEEPYDITTTQGCDIE
jgi:parallel beta-helix repeat protein